MGRAIDKVLSQPPPASSRATPYRQPPPLCHDFDTSIQEGTIPSGDSPPGLAGLQVEHPIDVSIISLNRNMIEY
jgi:hypothetical protein